jgi:hypothetical protein
MARRPADTAATRTRLTRLTPGDFYEAGDLFETILRRNATAYFLSVIARNHRHVLCDLATHVLPAYREAVEELRTAGDAAVADELCQNWVLVQVVRRPEWLEELASRFPGSQHIRRLKNKLYEWANRYRLNLPHLADTALATVAAWLGDPDRAEQLLWNHYQATDFEPMIPTAKVQFAVEAWSPRGETEANARRRLQESLLGQLDQYMAQVKADKAGLKWRPSPTKTEIESHMGWLALYQVEGLSISEIARRCLDKGEGVGTARKRIAAGIDSAGELLAGDAWPDWKRRPSRGGRPKKSA